MEALSLSRMAMGSSRLMDAPGRPEPRPRNVVEIADVRDQHVNRFAHVASPCLITRGLDRLFRINLQLAQGRADLYRGNGTFVASALSAPAR